MQRDFNLIWEKCMSFFKDNLTDSAYSTWFLPIRPTKLEDNTLTLEVPSGFFHEYLEEHYIDLIEKALRKEVGNNARLLYDVVVDHEEKSPSRGRVTLPGRENTRPQANKQHQNTSSEIRSPFIMPGIKPVEINPQLNGDLSFDNYIEGRCNKVARSAGMAIADNPGNTPFNPLFVYGGSGFGKTHIVQAIGLKIKHTHPNKTILYVSANQFRTQYTESVRNGTVNDFINFYQLIDVLIIDDIHDLANNAKTQNTFFHIFNHLHQSGKQLILTSDKPPFNLEGIDKRLITRFKWGLTAEIEAPDYNTRKGILMHKVQKGGLDISEEVINFIAENVISSIRELEGIVISLMAQSTFNGDGKSMMEIAQDIVSKMVNTSNRTITIDKIQNIVCDHFNLEINTLTSKSRKREIVQARQIAMYLAKYHTRESLQNIGRKIGDRDHATVLHACKTVSNLMDTDKSFKAGLKELELKLKF